MAKQIIALEQTAADVGYYSLRVLFWVPCNPPYPNPAASSLWTGASTAETDALKAGTVLEFVQQFRFPIGTANNALKATLNAAYTSQAASLPPKATFYGVFFDPSTGGWSTP